MKKTIAIFLLLLLTACGGGQAFGRDIIDRPILPPQAINTPAEKVVTLVPETAATRTPLAATATAASLSEDQAVQTAAENMKAFLGAPQLELTFKEKQNSPNAVNHPAYLFVDQFGNGYYISQSTLQPLEFTILYQIAESNGAALSADELLAAATQLAMTHSTKFEKLHDRLKYSGGTKGGENNFFRWELEGTDVGGGMPAILQIGLKQDGTLFSYLNSLDLLP